MANLLSIKLHRPSPPLNRVHRPALILRLNEGAAFGRPLTLVSAPAGFGKTACVSEWLSESELPAAWLSLDSDDNDPGRFFTYLFAALKQIEETLGRKVFSHVDDVGSVVSAGQLPPLEVIANAIIADISELSDTGKEPERFAIVLDDFHLIQDRFILKVFEKLFASLFQPNLPQPLNLVLLTREDPALPLARLRANNQLTEIRASDLRFSGDETGRFLNEVMGLGLTENDIVTLEERTEGWIAGLQLAGLSIRGRSDSSSFIQGISGSHRFILNYLTEEVLSRQPEDIQQFMLETSILDRLSGDVCSAVTGRVDSALLLEQLWNANLFLVPLDDEQLWYRYHHLFADLLRSRQSVLQGEKTAELHRRASRWFAQTCSENAGMKLTFSERAAMAGKAIEHALAAADYNFAAQLIENHAAEIINQWYAKAVEAWMQALPPEWSARSPRINLSFARMNLIHGNIAQAAPYLERLQALFSSSQAGETSTPVTNELKAEWLALQSTICSVQGRPAEGLELAKQALAVTPAQDANAQSQVYLALAAAYQQLDDSPRAADAYQRLIQIGRASADIISELLGISALVLMLIEGGQLRYGFELASQGAERVERSGVLPPICAGIYGELGQICYHWHQLDKAEQYFQRGAQVSALSGFSDSEIYDAVMRSRLCQIRGDVDAAAREIQKAAAFMRADAPVVVREEVIAQQVWVLLSQNNLAAAERILSQETNSIPREFSLRGLDPGQNISYIDGVLYISALRILLYRALFKNEPESTQSSFTQPDAIEQAGHLLDALRQRNYLPLVLQTLLLRAQLYAALGDPRASLADFSATLDLAEPEGYISDFVVEGQLVYDALVLLQQRTLAGSARAVFIEKILGAFHKPEASKAVPAPEPPGFTRPALQIRTDAVYEPLTDREKDVLLLIAEGRTYEEIAAKLVVSINTVRSHVKAIYGKLAVNNRTAAIEAARTLKIL